MAIDRGDKERQRRTQCMGRKIGGGGGGGGGVFAGGVGGAVWRGGRLGWWAATEWLKLSTLPSVAALARLELIHATPRFLGGTILVTRVGVIFEVEKPDVVRVPSVYRTAVPHASATKLLWTKYDSSEYIGHVFCMTRYVAQNLQSSPTIGHAWCTMRARTS